MRPQTEDDLAEAMCDLLFGMTATMVVLCVFLYAVWYISQ